MDRHRRSIRLPTYDYASAGAYFVTICAYGRQMLFEDESIRSVIQECWDALPDHFAHVAIDEFVIMPNHVHGVVWILRDDIGDRGVGAQHALPLRLAGAPRGSLGAIVGSFKSAVTKRVNELNQTPGAPLWQRNYYERVIRDDDELNRIREYIQLNPLKWSLDRDNPDRTVDDAWGREWEWLEGDAP